ncbi:MAG: methyltransferase domain-containing protein [Candidatus Hatepunaea meridiana]|nr:methyltransferase domain-containing protein [Candidatus Hatepunaea meridiana]
MPTKNLIYKSHRSILRSEWKAAAQLWNEHFAPFKGWTVDLGAGKGGFWNLVEPPGKLFLLDITRCFSKDNNDLPKVIADACHPPFKENSVDCVVALGLTEYLEDISQFFTVLREVVSENGKILFSSSPPIVPNIIRKTIGLGVYPRSDIEILQTLERTGWKVYSAMPVQAGWQSLFAARSEKV